MRKLITLQYLSLNKVMRIISQGYRRTVLLCVQGTSQLLAAIVASKYQEKFFPDLQTDYTLVVYDLFSEHRDLEFVEAIFKLSSSWDFKIKKFLSSEKLNEIIYSFHSQSKKNQNLQNFLGIPNVDEIYLCRNYIGCGSLMLMNAYPDAKKITYGDGYGVVSTRAFFEENQYQRIHQKKHLYIFNQIKIWVKKTLAKIFGWNLPLIDFNLAILTIPIDYCGQYLSDILYEFTPFSVLEEVLDVAQHNVSEQFQSYAKQIKESRKIDLLLLPSTLTESKYTSLENEVSFYLDCIRPNCCLGNLIAIKEHPRNSSQAVEILKEKLEEIGYEVIILNHLSFNFIPIELSIEILNPELVMSFGSSSAITLSLFTDIKNIAIHPVHLIQQYFFPETIESTLDFQIVIADCIDRIDNGWRGGSVLWSRPYPYEMNSLVNQYESR